jgi:multidrug resistance protein MdtO
MNVANAIVAGHPRWLAWLERELAPTPGRGVATARVVISIALVILTSMTLELPFASTSAFMVLFISNRNQASTVLAGMLLIVGATLAIAATVLLLPYVVDRPELRLPVMALLLLGGMYLSRVFVIGPLAFTTGFIMALALGEVSTLPPYGELIVRGCLWIWVAATYAIVVTVATGQFLLPTTQPLEDIAGELDRRLAAAHDAVRGSCGLPPSVRQAPPRCVISPVGESHRCAAC